MSRWVVIAAGLLLVLTAWNSTGHHQGDEYFQILEFAAYKLGVTEVGELAWEYEERMRPALQPAIAYAVYRLLGGVGSADPFLVAFLLRLLSAACTLWVAALLYRRYVSTVPNSLHSAFTLLLLFHWCAYYNGVRFSSENWSGLAAVLGLLTYPIHGPIGSRQYTTSGGRSSFLSGVCFGLAFLFRYQAGLLAAGFGLWLVLVYRPQWQAIARLVAGGLTAVVVAYPLTYWLYGEWTLPAYNYFAANLIEGRAAGYGTLPWYGYFELVVLRGIPPLGLLYLGGTIVFLMMYRRDPVSWMVAVFVLVHMVLARKDIRFLFPLIPLLPVLLAGTGSVANLRYGPFWQRRWVRGAAWLCFGVNVVLLLSVVVRRADSGTGPAAFIYRTYPNGVNLTGPGARMFTAEGTTPRFYLRPGTRVVELPFDTTGTCGPAPEPCLYVEHSRQPPELPVGSELQYTDRTPFIDAVNVLGWADREKWWYVYRLPDG